MKWFTNLKTAVKLTIGFSIVCALMAVVGYMGVSRVSEMNELLNTLYTRDMTGLSHVKEAKFQLMVTRAQLRQAIIDTTRDDMLRAKQAVETARASLDSSLAAYEKTVASDSIKAKLADARVAEAEYMRGAESLFELALANRNAAAAAKLREMRPAAEKFAQLVNDMSRSKETLGKLAYEHADDVYLAARRNLIWTIALGVLFSLGFGVFLARLISRPLVEAAARANELQHTCIANLRGAAEKLAAGDLTVRVVTATKPLDIETKDEVGEIASAINGIIAATHGTVASFEQAVESIRATLGEVRSTAHSTATGAQQLKAASQEISSGAQEQASSLEETAASLEEMTATIKQNADNAQQAARLAGGAREVAEKGGQVVSQAVVAMGEINQSSKQIGDIITTIDEIAFQTNLLALNAAVEAARAGQQGRGFAVVAGEVRKLAQRSATAAKEIKGLIQDSVRKVENGSSLVNDSGKTLDEIVVAVKRVTDIVAEIAAASKEQATGIDQLNRAVIQMDQVTQQNASQTEELSGTAESLAAQADVVRESVSRFRIENETGVSASAQSVAARQPAGSRPARAPKARATIAPRPAVRSALAELNGMSNGNGNGHHGGLATLDAEFEEF